MTVHTRVFGTGKNITLISGWTPQPEIMLPLVESLAKLLFFGIFRFGIYRIDNIM